MPLGKGASRHTVGGSRRGTITHLLALSLGISLGSFISNLGGPLGLSGYFGSPREAGEGSGTGGTPNPARSGAERGGHFDARQDAPGTYAEWISRVMPPSLAPVYVAPGALPFNLTMSILRRTRPVVGSTDRVRGFLTKLKKGQCTTSLMLGGSVTAGHNGGGPSNAYVRKMIDDASLILCEDNVQRPHHSPFILSKNSTTSNTLRLRRQTSPSSSLTTSTPGSPAPAPTAVLASTSTRRPTPETQCLTPRPSRRSRTSTGST